MLKTKILAPGVLEIIAPPTLQTDDFLALAPQIDSMIRESGKIRLLIDASHLQGWTSLAALEKHAGFVKDHQTKVARVAVIAGAEWQHWLAAAVGIFLDPKVKVFDPDQGTAAARWLTKVDSEEGGNLSGDEERGRVVMIADDY